MSIERGPDPIRPLPWSIDELNGETSLLDAEGHAIACDMQYYPWVDAREFPAIVHRVNSSDALCDELEGLRQAAQALVDALPGCCDSLDTDCAAPATSEGYASRACDEHRNPDWERFTLGYAADLRSLQELLK